MWPMLSTLLNWMTIFEWHMARLVVKNGHQKGMRCNEIGACAHNVDTTL